MATYTIAARHLPAQSLYKDGEEILPNPRRMYRVNKVCPSEPESTVSCVDNPKQTIVWTLYTQDGKAYCKRSDALFWHICDMKPIAYVPPSTPTVVACAPRNKRIISRIRVNIINVKRFIGL